MSRLDNPLISDSPILKMLSEMIDRAEKMPKDTSVFQQKLVHAIAHQTKDKKRLMTIYERMIDANMRILG